VVNGRQFVLASLFVTVVLAGCGLTADSESTVSTVTVTPDATIATPRITSPSTTATTGPPKIVYTYSVRGKGDVTSDMNEFAGVLAQTLSDSRGWSMGGQIAFQHVDDEGDFTVWLAAASTMTSFGSPCSKEYSCRNGRNVIINEERWKNGGFLTMELADYRQMVINHETGHWLGLDHSSCPGRGEPANLMQQQSKGGSSLGACIPNAWPRPSELRVAARARSLDF
jgi:hypothetical protein